MLSLLCWPLCWLLSYALLLLKSSALYSRMLLVTGMSKYLYVVVSQIISRVSGSDSLHNSFHNSSKALNWKRIILIYRLFATISNCLCSTLSHSSARSAGLMLDTLGCCQDISSSWCYSASELLFCGEFVSVGNSAFLVLHMTVTRGCIKDNAICVCLWTWVATLDSCAFARRADTIAGDSGHVSEDCFLHQKSGAKATQWCFF